MTALAYTNRAKAFTIGELLSHSIAMLINYFLTWVQTSLERFSRHLSERMLQNERRTRHEQWQRAKALAQLKAMTNGGEYVRVSPMRLDAVTPQPPTGPVRTILHSELERGDLAWIRVKRTGQVIDGVVVRRHPIDGWTEFRKGPNTWALLDSQFELFARVRVPKEVQE